MCRIASCRQPLGARAGGFATVNAYIKHVKHVHIHDRPEDLDLLCDPQYIGTTLTVHAPGAATTLHLVRERLHGQNGARIPFLPGTPDRVRAPPTSQFRPASSQPRDSDISFAAALNVATLLKLRVLPLLSFHHGDVISDAARAITRVLTMMGDLNNTARTSAGVHLWLLYPRLIFWIPQAYKTQDKSITCDRLTAKLVASRLKRFLAGDWRGLLLDYLTAHCEFKLKMGKGYKPPPLSEHQMMERRVAQLLKHIQVCNIRSTRTVLANDSELILGDSTTVARMEALQFDRKQALDLAAILGFQPSTTHTVNPKALLKAVAGMQLRKAGGPSGMRSDHLTDLIVDSTDAQEALVPVVQRIINGDMPPPLMKLFIACNLFAVRQKVKDKLRPVTTCDWLLRVVGRYDFIELREVVLERCEPLQLGASRNGCESVVHATNFFASAGPVRPGFISGGILLSELDATGQPIPEVPRSYSSLTRMVMIQADMSSAFQLLERQAMFQTVMRDPELDWLVPYMRLVYTQDSDLYLQLKNTLVATLSNRNGAKQGHTDSSPLFCLTTLPALKEVVKLETEDGDRLVDLLACIVDDTTILCPEGAVPLVLTTLKRESGKVGQELNYGKTRIYLQDGILDATTRALGVKCIDDLTPSQERGVIQLGLPRGHQDFRVQFMEKKLAEMQDLCDKITTELRPHLHGALGFVTKSLIPMMNHICREAPPSFTLPYMKRFDDMVITTVFSLLDIDLAAPDQAWADTYDLVRHQMRLKLTLGGLGVISQAKIAPAAYVASVFDSMHHMARMGSVWTSEDNPDNKLWMHHQVELLFTAICTPWDADDPTSQPFDLEGIDLDMPTFLTDLVDAMRLLPTASLRVLRKHMDENNPFEPPKRKPTDDADEDDDDTDVHYHLQHKLAVPIHLADEAAYRTACGVDPQRLAQHLSQRRGKKDTGEGWLGAAFMSIHPKRKLIDSVTLATGLRIYLALPDPSIGNEDTTCLCGRTLHPTKAVHHFWTCTQHMGRRNRFHDAFGHGFNDIYNSLPGQIIIQNEKKGVPTAGDRMDKVISGAACTNGKRICQDQTLCNPAGGRPQDLANAVGQPNYTANRKHQAKLTRYPATTFNQRDQFFPVACEIFGGIHDSVVEQLRDWAKATADHMGKPAIKGTLLQAWREHLSLTLLKARVAWYQADLIYSLEPDINKRRSRGAGSFLGRVARQPSWRIRWHAGG